MKKAIRASFVENENHEKFFYIDFTTGRGRPLRVWLSGSLVDQEGNITFPTPGVLTTTEKGSLVLRKNSEYTTHYVYVHCGYRGGSSLEILQPENCIAHKFYVYRSPRGRLGISEGALVSVKRDEIIKYKWGRSGRLYGGPAEGITIVLQDGDEQEFANIPDGLEALQEIKDLTD